MRKRILESDKDCLVFIQHPISSKNRDYALKYEKFAKANQNSSFSVLRMKSSNESPFYKCQVKPPTILLFKKGQKDNPIELDIRQDLTKASTTQIAINRLTKFVNSNLEDV